MVQSDVNVAASAKSVRNERPSLICSTESAFRVASLHECSLCSTSGKVTANWKVEPGQRIAMLAQPTRPTRCIVRSI
jgi:hypothetical protein